jgi:small subunit ribosomal protein S20
MRQSEERNARNRAQRSKVRNAVKKVRAAASAKDAEAAFRQAERLLDQAARKRLVHPNAAARQKARLVKALRAKSA